MTGGRRHFTLRFTGAVGVPPSLEILFEGSSLRQRGARPSCPLAGDDAHNLRDPIGWSEPNRVDRCCPEGLIFSRLREYSIQGVGLPLGHAVDINGGAGCRVEPQRFPHGAIGGLHLAGISNGGQPDARELVDRDVDLGVLARG